MSLQWPTSSGETDLRDTDFPQSQKTERIHGINGLKRNLPFSNGNTAIAENDLNGNSYFYRQH